MNSWGSIILVVRRKLRPNKCYYTVNMMKPKDNGEPEYVQEKNTKVAKNPTNENGKELDDLWEDIDEGALDDLDPVVTSFMVPCVNRDAAMMKCLSNNKSANNLELWIQSDIQCISQVGEHKEMWKNGPEKQKQPTFRQAVCDKATPSNCGLVQNTDWGHVQPRWRS